MNMRWIVGVVACGLVSLSAPIFAYEKPPFPRLAVNWLNNQNYEDPAVQRALARGHVTSIAVWPGWEVGRGTTVEQVIKNVKAINPRTLVFAYIANNEIPTDRAGYGPYAELYAKLDAMRWYLYASGTGGSIVDAAWPGAHAINNTLLSSTDANGDRWVDWFARWAVNKYAVPNPSLDGFNSDNIFWKPRVAGDYNRDGTTDSHESAAIQSAYRQGEVRHFTRLNQLMPGKFQIGNIADWGDPTADLTEYQGVLNGGVLEAMIGTPHSVESWGGWHAMMAWYRKTINALAEPKLAVFHQIGNASDYQGMRYGMTSCLMDDGYYAFGDNENPPIFDEQLAALGNATSSPPTSAWQQGVYRRDFENGIALVNPKGNGTRQITLEGDFKRLSGSQAPAVNNGQTVRTLTLQDRDGIILLRLQPTTRPAPPLLTVQ